MIRIQNHSSLPFSGWLRTLTDEMPSLPTGSVDGCDYVVGRSQGRNLWTVDVLVNQAILPHTLKTLDLTTVTAIPTREMPIITGQQIAAYGGLPTCGGAAMDLKSIEIDGACFVTKWSTRKGALLLVDLWLWWNPDEPWVIWGELQFVASNPASQALSHTVALSELDVRFGNIRALVRPGGFASIPISGPIADGQSRCFPVVFLQPSLSSPGEIGAALPKLLGLMAIRGTERPYPTSWGQPHVPAGQHSETWTQGITAGTIAALSSWASPPMGPNPTSGDTGAQADQMFVWAAACDPNYIGAEYLAYLNALAAWPKRPSHFRQVDGSLVSPQTHPNLGIWNGRPASWSQDQLGKTADLNPETVPGLWLGPDNEHWLMNGLAFAARTTYSPVLQAELEQQAQLYLLGWTVESQHPNWSTNYWWASRAVGYEMHNAVLFYNCLRDRQLAERVKARAIRRWLESVKPDWFTAPNDVVDVRTDDPRLGDGRRWLVWQQSLAAWGLYAFGTEFAQQDAVELAHRMALRVLADGFYQAPNGRWKTYSNVSVDNPALNDPDDIFYLFANPMAVAVVKLLEPTNQRAQAIWAQMNADATTINARTWMVPSVS